MQLHNEGEYLTVSKFSKLIKNPILFFQIYTPGVESPLLKSD